MTSAATEPAPGDTTGEGSIVQILQAVADIRENHGTGDPMQLFWAELAHQLDAATLGTTGLAAASRLARAYCRGAGLLHIA